MKAWIKHIVVAKTTIKHEVVTKASIFIAFGHEKNKPARRAGEKNNLAPILSKKKNSGPDINPSPPPPNIKWTVPKYNLKWLLPTVYFFRWKQLQNGERDALWINIWILYSERLKIIFVLKIYKVISSDVKRCFSYEEEMYMKFTWAFEATCTMVLLVWSWTVYAVFIYFKMCLQIDCKVDYPSKRKFLSEGNIHKCISNMVLQFHYKYCI